MKKIVDAIRRPKKGETVKPVEEALSKEERHLQEYRTKLIALKDHLFTTFFPADTWNVRQARAYGPAFGIPLLGIEGFDAGKEAGLVNIIFRKLGKRTAYFEVAYHFSDTLLAYIAGSSQDWVAEIAEQEGIPKSKAAEQILANIQGKIWLESVKFEQFLESAKFRKAFKIEIDKKTGETKILDLPLNAKQLQKQWDQAVDEKSTSLIRDITNWFLSLRLKALGK